MTSAPSNYLLACALLGGLLGIWSSSSQAESLILAQAPGATSGSLAAARRGFITRIVKEGSAALPAESPPAEVLSLVRYKSAVGELAAYVTPDPGDGKRRPAIIWIAGGDYNSIGPVWERRAGANDQSASAYRRAGIVMMFPSLRGGNDNPGRREGFYGEVDDVVSAAEYLAGLSYVDPQRLYLGGHSTGGTLVMLVAEITPKFRATFAFGPVDDARRYGERFTFHGGNPMEAELRAPVLWLDSVTKPLFVIEGHASRNVNFLRLMQARNRNAMIQFRIMPWTDHFSVLAPANELIASKIVADDGEKSTITITDRELEILGNRR